MLNTASPCFAAVSETATLPCGRGWINKSSLASIVADDLTAMVGNRENRGRGDSRPRFPPISMIKLFSRISKYYLILLTRKRLMSYYLLFKWE